MVRFLKLVLRSYMLRGNRSVVGLCKCSYDVYWSSYYGNNGFDRVRYCRQSQRLSKHLNGHCFLLEKMYQYSTDINDKESIRERDVSQIELRFRNYYHWHPRDAESRIEFINNLILHYETIDKAGKA